MCSIFVAAASVAVMWYQYIHWLLLIHVFKCEYVSIVFLLI